LKGYVNTFDSETSAMDFKYSLYPNMDSYTAVDTNPLTVNGNGENAVTTEIQGLTLGVRYYYTFSATNFYGTNTTAVESFLVGETPTVLTSEPYFTNLRPTFVANVMPGGAATTVKFRISKHADLSAPYIDFDAAPQVVDGVSQVTVLGTLSENLDFETRYYFNVTVRNQFGESTSSIDYYDTPEVDLTHPTVAISSNVNHVDPTDTFQFTVTFSKEVTGFTLNDLVQSGSSSNWVFSSLSNGSTNLDTGSESYTVTATPASATVGILRISLPADSVVDSFGNPNDASNLLSITVGNPQQGDTPAAVQEPVKEPAQTASITGIAQDCPKDFNTVVIKGSFVAPIANISINNKNIDRSLWVQSATEVRINVASLGETNLEIQILNGQIPLLAIQRITIVRACAVVAPDPTPTPTEQPTPEPTPTPTTTPTPKPTIAPKVFVAISFSANSAVISSGQLAALKKSLSKFKGTIRVAGFKGRSKLEKKASLADKRAAAVKSAIAKIAPKLVVVIARPVPSALNKSCSTLIPKAANQCAVVYSEK
jgi:hypothetical protein